MFWEMIAANSPLVVASSVFVLVSGTLYHFKGATHYGQR
jgi:hypothetical protein